MKVSILPLLLFPLIILSCIFPISTGLSAILSDKISFKSIGSPPRYHVFNVSEIGEVQVILNKLEFRAYKLSQLSTAIGAGVIVYTIVLEREVSPEEYETIITLQTKANQEAKEAEKEAQKREYDIGDSIASKKLVEQYNGNEAKADANYKGKVLRIIGIAKSIQKSSDGTQIVLVGDDYFNTTDCTILDSELSKALSLSEGDTVFVDGKIRGLFNGSVKVDECRVILP